MPNGVADALAQIRKLEATPPETDEEKALMADLDAVPKREEPKVNKSFYQKLRDNELGIDDIPEDIKQEWTRSVLGGQPFTHKVPMMGGRVKFVFSELDEEAAKLHRELSWKVPDSTELQTMLSILLFFKGVEGDVEIHPEIVINTMNFSLSPSANLHQYYDELCGKLPVGLTRLLIPAWNIYSIMVSIMMNNAMPDSF